MGFPFVIEKYQDSSQLRIHQSIMTAMGSEMRSLMEDDSVIEIMLNPDGILWAEYLGKGVEKIGNVVDKNKAETLIRLVASYSNSECNYNTPSLSAVLPMSSARFQAFVPPVVNTPCFIVRKRATAVFSLKDYEDGGIIKKDDTERIRSFVRERKNFLIVGGTGTGKTTLANAILKEMALYGQRIVTIEDTPELQCEAPNTLQFYTKPEVGFTMQKAVKDSLRCRPDRIVVGEVRDGSALDLLKAWNTGHSGGIATIHANSAMLGLKRLESLIQEVSVNIPKDLIAETVNVVINIIRTPKGRSINEICEVIGVYEEKYRLDY